MAFDRYGPEYDGTTESRKPEQSLCKLAQSGFFPFICHFASGKREWGGYRFEVLNMDKHDTCWWAIVEITQVTVSWPEVQNTVYPREQLHLNLEHSGMTSVGNCLWLTNTGDDKKNKDTAENKNTLRVKNLHEILEGKFIFFKVPLTRATLKPLLNFRSSN